MAESAKRHTHPMGALLPDGALRLTVLHGPVPEGMTFILSGKSHGIGRKEGDVILAEDESVNPSHATITRSGKDVRVADEESVNGLWVRVSGTEALAPGQLFRAGDEFFCAEILSDSSTPAADGTAYFASPRRKGSFRVLQILEGGRPGLATTSADDRVVIGAAEGTVTFGEDPLLSARHVEVAASANGLTIKDLGSTNGTWLQVRDSVRLAHGDMFFVGSTLLRAELI